MYDPEIWDKPGFALVLSWLAQKWNRRCQKLAPSGKSPEQYLTKEQQKVCLDSAAAELIREIKQLLDYLLPGAPHSGRRLSSDETY
jgi:hypothetical protein